MERSKVSVTILKVGRGALAHTDHAGSWRVRTLIVGDLSFRASDNSIDKQSPQSASAGL